MYNITLIASVHKERGICTSDQLYKIIEQVDPEIIFEEIPPSLFDSFYEGSRTSTLEISTIKKYLQNHPISHLPVDLEGDELLDMRLKKDFDDMLDIFEQLPEYMELMIQREVLTERYGFPYLNSAKCMELIETIHSMEGDMLRMINNDELNQIYKAWKDINDKRENGMIKNIYNYSALNKYNRALFLIGAEHRKSIMDKTSKPNGTNEPELKWIFDF